MWPDAAIVLWLDGISAEQPSPILPSSQFLAPAKDTRFTPTAAHDIVPPTPPTPPESLQVLEATRVLRSRKRRCMEEMPGGDTSRTPTKRAKRGRQADELQAQADAERDTDPDNTPRAGLGLFEQPFTLPAKSTFDASPSTARTRTTYRTSSSVSSHAQSGRSVDSASSSKRKRDEISKRGGSQSPSKGKGSPQKMIQDRIYAPYGVSEQPIQRISSLPEPLQKLALNLGRYFGGTAVLPEQHAAWLPEISSGLSGEDDRLVATGSQSDERREIGAIPDLQWAQRMVAKAIERDSVGAAEDAWNCVVHYPIIEKALELTSLGNDIKCELLTSARIHPQELVPERTTGELAGSKKVDFCICFGLGRPKQDLDTLFSAGYSPLNHTDYPPVKFHPIAVSMETKRSLADRAEATVQLGTWGAAHFRFLKRLLAAAGRPYDPKDIPPLPMLLLVGHEWRFYLMEDRGSCAVMWRDRHCIETSSTAGLYGIIAGLQYLIKWTKEVYRPWFLKNIVRPLLGEPPSDDEAEEDGESDTLTTSPQE